MTGSEKKSVELKISGMHCSTCAGNLEEALVNVRAVSSVQVDFGTGIARVEFDPSKVSLVDLETAVRDAGCEVINREAVLKVSGMMCAHCAQTIEVGLRNLPGVVRTDVNLKNKQVYVTYNPSFSSTEDMKQAIEDAGFQYLGLVGDA
jgi:Cu+-exporting ATPase